MAGGPRYQASCDQPPLFRLLRHEVNGRFRPGLISGEPPVTHAVGVDDGDRLLVLRIGEICVVAWIVHVATADSTAECSFGYGARVRDMDVMWRWI